MRTQYLAISFLSHAPNCWTFRAADAGRGEWDLLLLGLPSDKTLSLSEQVPQSNSGGAGGGGGGGKGGGPNINIQKKN